MILIDASIWIDHLRAHDPTVYALLDANQVLVHPYLIGEIALGNLRRRSAILGDLALLPKPIVAGTEEALLLIERHALAGTGIGYVDVHLLASVLMTADATLWTRDKRLRSVAERLRVAAPGLV